MKFYTCLIFIMLGMSSHAQYIKITELDESGNTRILNLQRQAIDINSKLRIEIDKEAIMSSVDNQLLEEGSDMIDSIITTLHLYKNYIEKLDASIQQYAILFSSGSDSIELTALRSALRERGLAGQAIVRLFPEGSRFQRRREEELAFVAGKGSNENFRVIMRLLAEEMQFAENDLNTLREDAGYYFQLAAWFISSRGSEPLHLDGFDDLPPGEFFHFERNSLFLTPQQLAELQQLNDFFENVDESNLFEKLADVLPGMLEKAIDTESITDQIQDLKNNIQALTTSARAEKENILRRTNQIETNFRSVITELSLLREKYTMASGSTGASSKIDLLSSFTSDVNLISNKISTISNDIKDLIGSVDFQALGEGISNIKNEFTELHKLLSSQALNLVDHAREAYQFAVYGRQINTAALELSEKILKLSINKIPASTEVDLHYAGKREPGDLLVVKAMLWKGGETNPVVTEVRDLPVMNALPHVHMTVAYTFSKPETPENNFKGGPLVSILYKFKSHSLPYRNFINAGIGIHAASYDFNNDDTPEFAGGIVGSIFRDYVQAGYGFNFNANKPYWFAGLRIPIPTAPVSIANN